MIFKDDDFHTDEADWRPLESILPIEQCAGFMYMGVLVRDGVRLHHYKHSITRRYIFITDDLKTYRYLGDYTYVPQPRKKAIHHALWELELFERLGMFMSDEADHSETS